jgi:hypothetical protein
MTSQVIWMRKDCLGRSCIVLRTSYFLLQFVVWFLCQKTTQTIVQVTYIFCTISGSKITTEHFSGSCVIVHSLPPEISVQYFLFITTVIIYNCICYSYVISSLSPLLHLNCTQFPARHWLAELLLLPLLWPQYHSWVNSWTKCTDWKHARRMLYVDSNTQWKAELFLCLSTEGTDWQYVLTCKPAAEMQVHASPGRGDEKISSYRRSVAFMNDSVSKQWKKTKILGYKDTLFRL